MKNKYSIKTILSEAWGDNWGEDWGFATEPGGWDGIAATSGFVDGYTVPLGMMAGFGYEGEDRIYTSVHDYENDYSGEFADYKDNSKAKDFSLSDMAAKASAQTFGSSNPGNTFTGNYADYKAPKVSMPRDEGQQNRRLSDILPREAENGPFTKALRSRSLGNAYKHFKKV